MLRFDGGMTPAPRTLIATLAVLVIASTSCQGSTVETNAPIAQNERSSTATSEATGATQDEAARGDALQELVPDGFVEISNGSGGFVADVGNDDRFGRDHDSAGDIDGDGVTDLVVGARSDDDGPTSVDGLTDAGAVYILFMDDDGSVRANQKISSLEGGFTETLVGGSFFGYGVAGIGDYDGDGIPDIAASAPRAQGGADGFSPTIYILHLNRDGTVKSTVASPGIVGQGLSAVGDLNGDGRIDLVAAQPDGGAAGLIHILFFDENSALIEEEMVTIGEGEGGFGTGLTSGDGFGGRESALLGDVDGDGSPELAVGAFTSDGGLGAIWVLSLDSETHQVIDKVKIAPGLDGFNEDLVIAENVNGTSGAHFGHALVAAGDLDGDGVPDLVTSANQYENGVVYVVYLNADASVKGFTRINEFEGGFDLALETNERFGRSMSIVRDPDEERDAITINMGGGAANRQGGSIYALDFQVELPAAG